MTLPITLPEQAGIGLRSQHLPEVLSHNDVPWVELLVDNWLAEGGLVKHYLHKVADRFPLTLHGVGLSLGGIEPLDTDYLKRIKAVFQETQACFYSEHLCFSQLQKHYSHDLLPLPYTEEAITHCVSRIQQVQDLMGERMLIENVSSYLEYQISEMSEAEFIFQVAEQADCYLILDVNNFYVSEVNHHQDALQEIEKLPLQRIKEIHLAGYEDKGDYLVDAHNNAVSDSVWQLYAQTLALTGKVPTLIEWDNNIPGLNTLLDERKKAQHYLEHVSSNHKTSTQCA